MKKRFLSLLLAMMMVLSLLPSAAFAANDSDYYFTIEDGVLVKCNRPNATHVTIPDSVTGIGDAAFKDCYIETITIPDSVTWIGNEAFSGCYNMTSITIPDSVTSFGRGAFFGCLRITSIKIPDSMTEIGFNTFYGCSRLTSVTIPDSVKTIGIGAFDGCVSLTSVTIPDSVQCIGDCAFMHSGLTSVTFPDSVESLTLGRSVFDDTRYLKNLTSDGDFFIINGTLLDYQGTDTEVRIPDSVTHIAGGAFSNHPDLNLVIPAGVTKIDSNAFCNINSVWFEDWTPSEEYRRSYNSCDGIDKKNILGDPSAGFQDMILNQTSEVLVETLRGVQNSITPQSSVITDASNLICAGTTSDYERAKAIFDWITANVAYDHDYVDGKKSSIALSPEDVLNTKLTICDGYANLTNALLNAQGIPAKKIICSNDAGHAWSAAYIDGKWIYIDSTWGQTWVNEYAYRRDYRLPL